MEPTDASALPEAARAFADGDVELLPGLLGAREIDALVALLVERGDAARLSRLGASPDKALAKAARRGLHLLRTRGAKVPAPEKHEYRVRGPYAEEAPSLASMIDGRGERIVWLVRSAPEGGYEVYQAELSETRGLIGFEVGAVSRREWRAHAEKVVADRRLAVGPIPSAHARWLIEQGYERAIAAGRSVPDGFASARLGMGAVVRPEAHPAIAAAPPLPVDEARPRLASLHELPEIAPWIPPQAALDALDLELGQIATSRLVVDPAGRRAQVAGAVERIAAEKLAPEDRVRLAERLRETALLLEARGAHEEARLCTTAAALTEDVAVPVAENPFLERLFEKLIRSEKLLDPEKSP